MGLEPAPGIVSGCGWRVMFRVSVFETLRLAEATETPKEND